MKKKWTDESVKRLWAHENKTFEHYFTYQVGENIVNYLKRYLGRADNILDYGCGMGFLEKYLLKHKYCVTAMDFTPDSVDFVNDQYKNIEKFKGAFYYEELLKKEKFDIVFLLEVIEHLDDYYLQVTVNNIKQLLKEDGYLVITTPNAENLEASYVYCPFCDTEFHKMQHVRSWSKETLRKFLQKNGFDIIEIEELDLRLVGYCGIKKMLYMAKKILIKIRSIIRTRVLNKNDKPQNLLCVARLRIRG